jgi:membrane protein
MSSRRAQRAEGTAAPLLLWANCDREPVADPERRFAKDPQPARDGHRSGSREPRPDAIAGGWAYCCRPLLSAFGSRRSDAKTGLASGERTDGRRADTFAFVKRVWRVAKRSVVSFYNDQGTHHAAALTYYALMSLFPSLLLAVSLLGLLGEYPGTYNAIVHHLRDVVPTVTLAPLAAAVRAALKSKGTALGSLVISIVAALYGATGYLEAARRALNVVFEACGGRSFARRKLIDIASTSVLMALLLTTLVLMFAGGGVAKHVLGGAAASIWRIVRWPAALASALLVFSYIYYVTPDVRLRGLRSVLPGALVGVALWLVASAGFSTYLANFETFNVTYGSFAAAIILLVWCWLSNVSLLLGAEVNAEIARAQQITGHAPDADTLDLPAAGSHHEDDMPDG